MFTFSYSTCSYGRDTRKGHSVGKEIHLDTFSREFILTVVLWCEGSLSVCALTEVPGNYWNIWMAGLPLNPLTNDAWLLQKGTGRTLQLLTDIYHQRYTTTSALVGYKEGERWKEMWKKRQLWYSLSSEVPSFFSVSVQRTITFLRTQILGSF